MNIERSLEQPFVKAHGERCRNVLKGHGDISAAVRIVRAELKQGDEETRRQVKSEIFTSERKVFSAHARAAIDAVLPGDTSVSGLAINKQLVNFVALATPNIRLRARAGSGKSTAIVIKCVFLIRALHMAPETIQILTFNKAAAEHLREKLRAALGDEVAARIGVNTFHSLAWNVLKGCPETQHQELVFSGEEPGQDDIYAALLEQVVRDETSQVELALYHSRYKSSSFEYMTEYASFEDNVRNYIQKAAILYRARRGVMAQAGTNKIRQHIARVAEAYDAKLAATDMLDGEMGLRRAAAILSATYNPLEPRRLDGQLQYLFVDEYQDFSAAFEEVTQALMARNPDCVLNVVGDDWQSINAFMGADPSFFDGFRSKYPPALNLNLLANFRSGTRIVALGNTVMAADAKAAAVAAQPYEGALWVIREGGIKSDNRARKDWHEDARMYIGEQIAQLADQAWDEDRKAGRKPGSLALLASQNKPFGQSLSGYAQLITPPEGVRVETSSVHSAKGGQWDHVILLDAIAGNYPSAHPADPVNSALLPAQAKAAEGRHLLYVAVTRAKHSLTILAPTRLHPKLSVSMQQP